MHYSQLMKPYAALQRPAEAPTIASNDDPRAAGTPRLTASRIHRENLAFAGTGGVSAENRKRRFTPAFRDDETGRVELSRYQSGAAAPMHVLDGLPAEWITDRDAHGRPATLKAGVVAGFVRDGRFYTREQAAGLSA